MLLYIAPKFLFQNESVKDGDAYSIAWLIYELIINEIPFDGLNHYKIDKKVVESGKKFFMPLRINSKMLESRSKETAKF